MNRRSGMAAVAGLTSVAALVLAAGVARSEPPPAYPPFPIPIPSWAPPLPSGWIPPFPSAWVPSMPTRPGGPPSSTAPGPGLPVPSSPFPGVGAGPRVEFRRLPDLAMRGWGPAARSTLLEHDRTHAWFGPNGVTVTSGGSAGSILAGGANPVPLSFADGFSVTFSPDGRMAALVQARSPASLISLPDGRVLWQHPYGLGCAMRFASPTSVILHDDGNDGRLWRVDLTTMPFRATPIGGTRRAEVCWPTPDGRQWIVSDGRAISVVDGTTGAAWPMVSGVGSVVGSPLGNRVCFVKDDDLFCQTASPPRIEHLVHGGDLTYGVIDEAGARLLFSVGGVSYVADFAAATIQAVPAAKLISGGWMTLVNNGHVIAGGWNGGTFLYNLDMATQTAVPRPQAYSIYPAYGRPRSVLTSLDNNRDLYLIDF